LSARVGEAVLVGAAYAAAALLLMSPVLPAPASRVYGLPSDPLSEVWRLDQFASGEIGLIGNTESSQANAPSGVVIRRPLDASQPLYDGSAWLLARALGPILAYNVLVFGGLWTTAIAAYGALRAVGVGWPGSALAGALFSAAPNHLVEAQLHVSLTYVFMLPVLLALGVFVLSRPTLRRGGLFGCALGACGYVNPYLPLEAGVLGVGVALAGAATSARHRLRPTILAAAAAFAAALVVVSPLLAVAASAAETFPARPPSDVATFSLTLSDYVKRSAGTYVGIAGVALAVLGLAIGRVSRLVKVVCASVAFAGLAASLRPELSLAGLEIPMPSKVIHALVPYWRVFGRNEIVVSLGVACLAGIFVDRVASSPRRFASIAALGIAFVALLDIARAPPPPAADAGRDDPIAAWLAKGEGVVAEYPLFGFEHYEFGRYLFRQLAHGRPLFNGSIDGTLSADLASVASTSGPQLHPALALAGVRHVVAHERADLTGQPGLELERVFPDGSVGYAVRPAPAPAVVLIHGAYGVEPAADGSPFRWLGPDAELQVIADPDRSVAVTFDAVSYRIARRVGFGAAGSREILPSVTPVRLCVDVGTGRTTMLPISPTPPAEQLPGGDPRVASIGVLHVSARAGCA
jgi:hypothetical protein